jgi:hypothetical protein
VRRGRFLARARNCLASIGSEYPTRRGTDCKRLVTYVEIDRCAAGAESVLLP